MDYMFTKLFSVRYLALLLIGLTGLSACKKQEDDTNIYSAIAVYNGSPTVATYDVYLNSTKINTAALPLGGSLAYSQPVAGNHTLSFSVAGRVESVYSKEVSLAANTYFSVFLVGKPSSFDTFTVTDDLSASSSTSAFVRFVNVSPDAGSFDLFSKTTSIATGQTFKTASKFIAVDAGAHVFDVKQSGTIKTSSESVNLVAGVKYTVLVRGLATPVTTEDIGLGVQVIQVK